MEKESRDRKRRAGIGKGEQGSEWKSTLGMEKGAWNETGRSGING